MLRSRMPSPRWWGLLTLLWLCPLAAAGSADLSVEGVWVSGELKRALEAGEIREVDCFLRIQRSPLQVIGTCGAEVVEWPLPALMPSGGAAVELRSEHRRLVVRAGAPNELELREGSRGSRLYRLGAAWIPTLDRWLWLQGRLVGSWRSEDGASLQLEADGSYRLEAEQGRYQAEGELASAGGAWGLLKLRGEGKERRYLLHGEGERLGLAPLPQDVDLEIIEARPRVAEAEEDALGALLAKALEELGAGGGGGEAAPRAEATAAEEPSEPGVRTLRILGGEEPEPSLWFQLVREEAGGELVEAPWEAPPAEADEGEPQPSEPILPKARPCGCSAGEGASAGLLVMAALLLGWSRALARPKLPSEDKD